MKAVGWTRGILSRRSPKKKEQKEQAKEKKLGGKKRPQAIGQVQDFDGIASGSGAIDEERQSIMEVVIYNKSQH